MISPQTTELGFDESNDGNQLWKWQNWEGLPYVTCSLLQPWPHGFFTQQFSPRSPAELVGVLEGEAEVYRVKQVHGNTVLSTGEIAGEMEKLDVDSFPEADGIVSVAGKQAIWVCTADCTPVLIGDEKTGQVAAIHAGWRGTAQKIVPVAIGRLLLRGSKLEDLRIAMGPAIAGTVYQVSIEVAIEVGASILPQKEKSTEILLALQELPNSPILPDPEAGKVRLDVRRVNELQLLQMGISSAQIAISPHCTYQQPEYFFSYRRDGLKKVQWSGIVSK